MRTRPYTIAQLTTKIKNRKPIISNEVYNRADANVLYILDKDFKPIGIDWCRETTCYTISEQIRRGKLPAYIGICLVESVTDHITRSEEKTVAKIKSDIIQGKFKSAEIKRANKLLVSRAYKMSSKITALEKRFKFETHTLRCLSPHKESGLDVYNVRWGTNSGKIRINIEIAHIWVFKLDNQWLSSPPVTSYVLLCMRDFAGDIKGNRLETRKMHQLISKNKPHVLFGRNRKLNWNVDKTANGDRRFFDDTYGVDSFERNHQTKAVIILRKRFPNNTLFKK